MGEKKPDQELKKAILTKLWRRKVFGSRYIPIEQALSKLPRHEWDKAKDKLEKMYKEGLIIFHKRKNCISINPSAKKKVKKILKDELPDYFFD